MSPKYSHLADKDLLDKIFSFQSQVDPDHVFESYKDFLETNYSQLGWPIEMIHGVLRRVVEFKRMETEYLLKRWRKVFVFDQNIQPKDKILKSALLNCVSILSWETEYLVEFDRMYFFLFVFIMGGGNELLMGTGEEINGRIKNECKI